jgi:phosphoglycolate phosphatase
MATNAGVAAVGVSYGAHAASTLAGLASLGLVDSTAELARWLATNA